MKVTVELTEEQARVVANALDLYARIWTGQIEEPFSQLRLSGRFPTPDREVTDSALRILKKAFFPELSYYASYGILSPEAGENAHIAWDIYQAIRYKLAWKKYPEGGHTVDFHKPMKASTTQKLPEVEAVQKLYVVVRTDLRKSQQAVQAGHAVAEWMLHNPNNEWRNGYLIYLKGPKSEEELQKYLEFPGASGTRAIGFREPDLDNELTAVAILSTGEEFKDMKLL